MSGPATDEDFKALPPLSQSGVKGVRDAAFKADTGDSGQYEAIVSVFKNVDYVSDVVNPGAYAAGLEEWKASGDPMPVIWSHQWEDPEYHIGYTVEAKEMEPGHPDLPESLKAFGGLYTLSQLDMDHPKAAKVFKLLKGRRIKQFSFHYDVRDASYGRLNGEPVRFLKSLFVNETGPTLLGVNRATQLLATKSITDGLDNLTAEEVELVRAILAKHKPNDQATESKPAEQAHSDLPRLGVDEAILRIALAEHGI
jgi:HK97 family phage prohead protease